MTKLHTEEYGDPGSPAVPVLLVHGLGGSSAHWAGVAAALALRRRVLCLDLPGFGGSRDLPGPRDVEEQARTLAAVADQHFPGRPMHWAGHSAGGPFVLRAAALAPAQTASVALVAGCLISVLRLGQRRRALPTLRRHPGVAAAMARELMTVALPVPAVLGRQIETRPRLRQLALAPFVACSAALSVADVRMLVAGAGAPGAVRLVRALLGHELTADLATVPAPLLVVTGDRDRLIPAGDIAIARTVAPHAVIETISGSGHLPMLERPDTVVAILNAFGNTSHPGHGPTGDPGGPLG